MQYITTSQAAEKYNVDKETIRRWARDGKLKSKKIGRKWLIVDED